jgi:hypothetical protein
VLSEIQTIQEHLAKLLPEGSKIPEVQAALVLTNPKVEIRIPEGEDPPAETIPLNKLKDLIRKSQKGKSLSVEKARQIQAVLAG